MCVTKYKLKQIKKIKKMPEACIKKFHSTYRLKRKKTVRKIMKLSIPQVIKNSIRRPHQQKNIGLSFAIIQKT